MIDTGTVYFTNKRIVFDGVNRNASVPLKSLIGFELWADAIKLEKSTGRSPVVGIEGDLEKAAVVITALAAQV